MRAIVLAAGRGSRLGRLGAGRPKCLVRLGGRTLLDWQRAAFAAAGVRQRLLVLGHAAERVAPSSEERVVVNPDWARGGPVASLLAAPLAWRRPGFLLVYGDVVFHPDLIVALRDHPGDLALTGDLDWHALWSARFADVLSDAEGFRFAGDRLRAIGRRSRRASAIQAQFTGLLKVSAAGWRRVESHLAGRSAAQVRREDTTGLLARLLAEGAAVHVVPIRGRWCEVDSASDVALYRARLRRRTRWSHDWRWPEGA